MFCPKCGKQIPENAVFCGFCGANIAEYTAPAAKAQTAQTQPVEQPVQTQPAQTPVQQPVYEESYETVVLETPVTYAAPAQEYAAPAAAPVKVKKPRSKKLVAFLAVILAIAAVVASVAFIPSLRKVWEDKVVRPVKGAFVENLGSDEDYLRFVEKEAFEGYDGYVGTVSNAYGTIMNSVTDNTYGDATLSVELSDAALELIKEAVGDIDLSFLNDTEIKLGAGLDGDFLQINAELGINGNTIIDPSLALDLNKGEMLISILTLSDKYIRADLADMDVSEMPPVSEYLDMVEKYADALPDEGELNKLLGKYVGIVLDELDEVEKGEEELEIGEITEKLTAVELRFTEETAADIVEAVLSEARDDKTIKKYINNVSELLENDGIIPDAGEIYGYFTEAVDSALASFEDAEMSDDVLFTLVDYVDASHKVVGRKLFMGDDTDATPLAFYGTVHDGKNYEFELVITGAEAPQVYISGSGVDKGGVLTGDYTITLQGMSLLKLSLEDFDMNALKSGKVKGAVIITPSKELLGSMGVGNIEMSGISMADIAVGLDLDIDGTSADITVNALVDGEVFAGVKLVSKMTGAPSVKTPSDKNVVDVEDVEEWLETVDLEKLVKNLKSAGLPAELTDALDELMENVDSPKDLFGSAVPSVRDEVNSFDEYVN